MLRIWHNLLERAWQRMGASFGSRKRTKLLQLGWELISGLSTSESDGLAVSHLDYYCPEPTVVQGVQILVIIGGMGLHT